VAEVSPVPDQRALRAAVAGAFDPEGKLTRAIENLGPVAGRSVLLVDGSSRLGHELQALGADVASLGGDAWSTAGDASADVLVSCFDRFRGALAESSGDLAQAERVLRPGGRLLVVHDYGRDDAAKLLHTPDEEQELVAWSHRSGWFMSRGFRLRVLHCWWTWASIEEARAILADAFGVSGTRMADALRRPRLEHKIGIYHRTLGESPDGSGALPGS
jgi:hypothetical protein